jgi:tetratricopeptide (TPR) repeat protein
VRVQPCDPPGLLATRVSVNLVDVDEATARERLLAAVGPPGPRPTHEPFPGATRFPGAGPLTTNLGPRNRTFTAPLAEVVTDPFAYNEALRVLGEFSMVTLAPDTIVVHRLVQTVVRARLEPEEEREWTEVAIALIRVEFPDQSWEVSTWPVCERLLPQLLGVAEHSERLSVAGEKVGWLLDRASTFQRERGQYRQALPLAERALTMTTAALGPDHVEVAWRHDELGRLLEDIGDLTGAREQYERALQIGEATLGPDHPQTVSIRQSLADLRPAGR